jgi:hypothetical protein
MLTPAYALTAAERVLPRLALDFTTAIADPRVATARTGNTATRFNSSGVIEIVNANLPRFDFNPSSLVCLGQLIEESRTNLFLNSLIDGTNLATQSVTLTAVTHTLSFYGSGSVDITGGHTATVAGVGDFPNRKTYTFTPSAGSSTFTVTGDVKFAQLEAGAFATSYIPTVASAATRNADVVSMIGTNFSDWYSASEGTFAVEYSRFQNTDFGILMEVKGSSTNTADRIGMTATSGADPRVQIAIGGVTTLDTVNTFGVLPAGSLVQVALAYKTGSNGAARLGGAVSSSTTAFSPPSYTEINIGGTNNQIYGPAAASFMNGHMQSIRFWSQRLTNAELQAFSK